MKKDDAVTVSHLKRPKSSGQTTPVKAKLNVAAASKTPKQGSSKKEASLSESKNKLAAKTSEKNALPAKDKLAKVSGKVDSRSVKAKSATVSPPRKTAEKTVAITKSAAKVVAKVEPKADANNVTAKKSPPLPKPVPSKDKSTFKTTSMPSKAVAGKFVTEAAKPSLSLAPTAKAKPPASKSVLAQTIATVPEARAASKGKSSQTRSVHALTAVPAPQSAKEAEIAPKMPLVASPKVKKASPSIATAVKKAVPEVAPPPPISAKSARIRREMAQRSQRALQNKDISSGVLVGGSAMKSFNGNGGHTPHKDRIVLIVRDCYWLQADWEITRAAVDRVRVAMSEKWHGAIPVLRVMSVADASANRAEQVVRDIPIHGGVTSWYIDVEEPPSRFRVVIGYVSESEKFFPICRSNVIETPRPGAANRIDEHWRDIAEDYERIYSLSGGLDSNGADDLKEVFEDRLKRSMPNRNDGTNAGSDTDAALDRHRALPFEVDAELIIYGSTIPGATVMLGGEPVKLRPDGSFTIRLALPDKRQVFPVVAQSRDGMRQRTTVVAVERNTKVMEPVDRDSNF